MDNQWLHMMMMMTCIISLIFFFYTQPYIFSHTYLSRDIAVARGWANFTLSWYKQFQTGSPHNMDFITTRDPTYQFALEMFCTYFTVFRDLFLLSKPSTSWQILLVLLIFIFFTSVHNNNNMIYMIDTYLHCLLIMRVG